MKIVIIGAGEVGCSIARRLSTEGHDIYLVEQDADKADAAQEELDVTVVCGNGARPKVMDEVLRLAGSLDLLAACTNRDETNMVACWIARKRGVKRVIARARNLEFTDSTTWARELGIDQLISPERSVAREITGLLASSSTRTEDLLDGRAALYVFRVEPDSPSDGRSLLEIRLDPICQGGAGAELLRFVVVYVEKATADSDGAQSVADDLSEGDAGVRVGALVPDGRTVLNAGDLCYVVMLKRDAQRLEALFRTGIGGRLRRVFVVGGGKVGYQVARQIRREYGTLEIRMVDLDKARCENLASEEDGVLVLNADGADRELLIREGIKDAGYVAATSDDEVNLIYASVAKSLGASRSVAVVRQGRYGALLRAGLPVDAIVNTNDALASVILGEVRYPGTGRTLSIIENIDAEMLELIIPDGFAPCKLMDLGLPRGAIVALRAKTHSSYSDVEVPGGDTVLLPGDKIILFAAASKMQVASNFFTAPDSNKKASDAPEVTIAAEEEAVDQVINDLGVGT